MKSSKNSIVIHTTIRYKQVYTCHFCKKNVYGKPIVVEFKGDPFAIKEFIDQLEMVPLTRTHMPVGFRYSSKQYFYCGDCYEKFAEKEQE